MTNLTSTPAPVALTTTPVASTPAPVASTTTPVASTPAPVASTTVPVAGDWEVQKGKLKAKFSVLTDADLTYEEGKRDDMLTKVQIKLGKTKEELAAIIAAL